MQTLPSMPTVFFQSPWGTQQGHANGYYSAFAGQGQGWGYDQHVNASWQGRQNFEANTSFMSTSKSGRKQPKVKEERPPTKEDTTICFQNIPNTYSRKMISEMLDENGFRGLYDFIYVPHDFKKLPTLANLGYFFVNFDSRGSALRACEKFVGFKEWMTECSKVMAATWASATQGKAECIEQFQNSPVMHEKVPPECKPVLIENGVVVHLTPTKRITKQPRFKSGYGQKLTGDSATQAVDDKETCSEDSEAMSSITTVADDCLGQAVDDKETCSEGSESGTAIGESMTRTSSNATDSDSDAHSAADVHEFQNIFALPSTVQLFEVRNTFIDVKEPSSIEERCGRRARAFTF